MTLTRISLEIHKRMNNIHMPVVLKELIYPTFIYYSTNGFKKKDV